MPKSTKFFPDAQAQASLGCCTLCAGELYPGDPVWLLEGQRVCHLCLAAFARQMLAPFETICGEDTQP